MSGLATIGSEMKGSLLLVILLVVSSYETSRNDRLDCYLEVGDSVLDRKGCEDRGCVYDDSKPPNGVPICYLDTKKVGYRRESEVKTTANGLEIDLTLKDTAKSTLKFSQQINNLKLEVTYLTDRIIRLRLLDANNTRYEVPVQKNFPLLQKAIEKTDDKQRVYSLEVSQSKDDFSFSVVRTATKTKLFDTSIGGLIYSDQLLQMATKLVSNNIYGLGENTHHQLRHDLNYRTYPLWTQDHGTGLDTISAYGVHPFYQVLEADGKSHGVLLLNSNAQEYTLLPEPAITFRTMGGVLDFFIFVGDNPGHVTSLYTSLIGRPALPPFWGLGFQLTRWGFKNTGDVQKVIDRNMKEAIPLDVMYMDIDYMDEYRDFTYSHQNFADLPALINNTKAKHNLHWTLILDPAIEANNSDKYPVFTDGYQKEVFIKYDKSVTKNQRYNPSDAPSDKDVIYGKVWPKGPAAFPDFFKSKTQDWWQKWIGYLYNDLGVKFDALWIDMNEPANQNDQNYQCPKNKYDNPQSRLLENYGSDDQGAKNMSRHTLCMVTRQGENDEYLHYDVHSLYGLTESIATQKALHSVIGKRSFSVSRSTFVSSGRYGTHWLGDNTSAWPHMKYSIIGMLEMNLFGIPFVGPDICGFLGNTTPEMCKRWLALGAFYPYSRQHNCIGNIDQDPAVWAEAGHPEVTEAARNSLRLRYQLLPYFYTLFYKSHTMGETVARPLFHEFPADNNTHAIDEQFMLGSSLLVSPFLYQSQTSVKAYLPNDIWYYIPDNMTRVQKTGNVVIPDNHYGLPPVHLRGNSIIPISEAYNHVNTIEVRNQGIELLVLPGQSKTASGNLFWDDGDSIDTIENKKFNYYSLELNKNCSLDINVIESGYDTKQVLSAIAVYGTDGEEVVATLDKQTIAGDVSDGRIRFNVNIDLKSKAVGQKWTLEWKSKKTNACNIL